MANANLTVLLLQVVFLIGNMAHLLHPLSDDRIVRNMYDTFDKKTNLPSSAPIIRYQVSIKHLVYTTIFYLCISSHKDNYQDTFYDMYFRDLYKDI